MIDPKDLDHCREAIRTGSLSFHAASKLLPSKVRDPALALYAFCRLADDAVDENDEKATAVLALKERLDLVYNGTPRQAPADRAFAAIVEQFDMPRALPDALLEGLAWDAVEKRYQTLSDVRAYSARVASAVGAMMCVLMGVRDADALARACDLGVAMQLTNIARDVGEDARARRIYLPLDWMEEAGIETESFFQNPEANDAVRDMVKRLLREAERLYHRSEAGISALPLQARTGIYAARLIYAGIGADLKGAGFDSINRRAHTTKAQKIGWIAQAGLKTSVSMLLPQSAVIYAKPLNEVQFLVDGACQGATAKQAQWGQGKTAAVLDLLIDLKTREQSRPLPITPMEPS